MLKQVQHDFTVTTRGRGFYEITDQVQAWVARTGIKTGLLTLHIPHTSASLLIQENADPDVRLDLERFLERLVPDGDPLFEHVIEGEDDMPAHIRTALTNVSINVPVKDGKLALGLWQGIYVWEHREQPHSRHVTAHLIGE